MENPPTKFLARHLYTVDAAAATCTVSTVDGILIGTYVHGKQGTFIAPEDDLVVSDPNAKFKEIPRGLITPVSGTYSNTSELPMSGTAVAQAISKVSTHVIDYGVLTESLDLSGYTIDTSDRTAATDELWLAFGDSTHQVTWPETWIWLEGEEPDFSANTRYCICVRNERNGCIIANVAYEY